MHIFFLFASLAYFEVGAARVISCPHVTIDGRPRADSSVNIDVQKILLEAVRGHSITAIITEDSIYPFASPNVSFDRHRDCTWTQSKTFASTKHHFTCANKALFTAEATLEIQYDQKSARYYGRGLIPPSPAVDFEALFENCR